MTVRKIVSQMLFHKYLEITEERDKFRIGRLTDKFIKDFPLKTMRLIGEKIFFQESLCRGRAHLTVWTLKEFYGDVSIEPENVDDTVIRSLKENELLINPDLGMIPLVNRMEEEGVLSYCGNELVDGKLVKKAALNTKFFEEFM